MSLAVEPMQSQFTSRNDLLATFDGDAEFVHELVLTFLGRVPVLLQAIESGFQASDRTAVSHAAHALKGSLGYFDQGSNHTNALRLEQITADEMARGPELLFTLHEGLDALTRYLAGQFGMDAQNTEIAFSQVN